MSLDESLRVLHASASAEALRSVEVAPSARPALPPPCLDSAAIHDSCRCCGFDASDEAALLETAERIAASPALSFLMGHCYRLLYDQPDYPGGRMARWPDLNSTLGNAAGLFYLLLALGAPPLIIEAHRRLNLPATMTAETCRGIKTRADLYRDSHNGRRGTFTTGLHWLRHYITGTVNRLGRFEYVRQKFSGGVEVYANRTDGRVLALAPDGAWFTADGYCNVGGPADQGAGGWQSSLRKERGTVIGAPINPRGMAERRAVRLPLAAWERVFGKGDWTLDMHIPAGGGMHPAKCSESLRLAADFFQDRFPDAPIRAISSNSWIFNNQLAEILPASSNLVLFQRELYLFPVPSNGQDGFWFIFQREDARPGEAPARTSLQQAVSNFLAGGQRWRGGGMFFLPGHLPEYGRQVYRSMPSWPAARF